MQSNKFQWIKSLFIVLTAALAPVGPGAAGDGTDGDSGILTVDPGVLDFGTVEAGDTAVMTATIANAADPSASALTLDALELGGGGMLDPSTFLASLLPGGDQVRDHSPFSYITPDGRYVVFIGALSENTSPQIFRHDLRTGTVEVASANSTGAWISVGAADDSFAISADGRYVAFNYSGLGVSPVPDGPSGFYIRDMDAGVTEYIDIPTTDGELPDQRLKNMRITPDFRFLAFDSSATNLVSGVELPIIPDSDVPYTQTYVYDRDAGTVELVSMAFDSGELGADDICHTGQITPDGRYVFFASNATNLVPGDSNGETDLFVHDRDTGITDRVSVASDGSEGNGDSYNFFGGGPGDISADGRYVVFSSSATNLVPDDTNGFADVFVRDRAAGTTERVSVAADGSQGLSASGAPSITADGRHIAFHSDSPNLVLNDTNGVRDVFIRDRLTGTNERVSVATDGAEANQHSFSGPPGLSADGRFVTFPT